MYPKLRDNDAGLRWLLTAHVQPRTSSTNTRIGRHHPDP